LRHELSAYIEGKGGLLKQTGEVASQSNKAFDIEIPEFSLEVILTGSSEVTAQNIVDLFRVAMKTRQKEILCWYCYYKAYEDRIRDVKSTSNIDDQSARTLVYNEIKALLPDITDVNLRQKTFRAKKIYTLFMGIGIDRIQAVTYSASAISNLKDYQIQGIINDFSKMADNTDEVIGVTDCNAHVTESSEVSESTAPISASYDSNSSDDSSSSDSPSKAVVTPIPQPNSPIHDQAYFRNKILKLYPGISYRRSNDRSEDVYNCKTKSSLCPSCETNHIENIVGRYREGSGASGTSYYIGCIFRYTGDLEVVA